MPGRLTCLAGGEIAISMTVFLSRRYGTVYVKVQLWDAGVLGDQRGC
jgi:hypothetical protein